MTDLLDAIDESWRNLLGKFTATTKDGKPTVPIAQQVEALQAAAKWTEMRAKLRPQAAETKRSRFDDIHGEFHRGAKRKPPGNPWGRAGRPPADDGALERAGASAESLGDEAPADAGVVALNGTAAATEPAADR